jgi:hypothetical protein
LERDASTEGRKVVGTERRRLGVSRILLTDCRYRSSDVCRRIGDSNADEGAEEDEEEEEKEEAEEEEE